MKSTFSFLNFISKTVSFYILDSPGGQVLLFDPSGGDFHHGRQHFVRHSLSFSLILHPDGPGALVALAGRCRSLYRAPASNGLVDQDVVRCGDEFGCALTQKGDVFVNSAPAGSVNGSSSPPPAVHFPHFRGHGMLDVHCCLNNGVMVTETGLVRCFELSEAHGSSGSRSAQDHRTSLRIGLPKGLDPARVQAELAPK